MGSAVKEKVSVGLDIGHHHINMVELVGGPGAWKLFDCVSVALSPRIGREERLKQLVKIVQEKEIKAYPVNIGVSGESVIVRYIELPKMNKTEVRQALRYEAQQYIPFKMEDVIFDYHIISSSAGASGDKMKILLVAARKQSIMESVDFIRQAGLKPKLIDVNSFCLINCFQKNGPKIKEDDVVALVNLEFDLVNIDILQGEIPFFTRDISLTEDDLSLQREMDKEKGFFERMKPALANLIREIRLSIDYFESEFEKQVSVIYFSGAGANDNELISFFNSQIGRDIKLWNPVQNMVIDSTRIDLQALKEVSPTLALACGLALRD